MNKPNFVMIYHVWVKRMPDEFGKVAERVKLGILQANLALGDDVKSSKQPMLQSSCFPLILKYLVFLMLLLGNVSIQSTRREGSQKLILGILGISQPLKILIKIIANDG